MPPLDDVHDVRGDVTCATIKTVAALEPLRTQRRWVLWDWVRQPSGKWDKPPFSSKDKGKAEANGKRKHAQTDQRDTWSTFEAVNVVAEKFSGVGFVLTDTNITAMDLDHCRNPETGHVEPWAQAVIDRANSYVEISPSGTGFRIIGTGNGPPLHRKLRVPNANGMSCELYRKATRYITVTGNVYVDKPLANIDKIIDAVLAELDPLQEEDQQHTNGRDNSRSGDLYRLVARLYWAGRSEVEIVEYILSLPADDPITQHIADQKQEPRPYVERQVRQIIGHVQSSGAQAKVNEPKPWPVLDEKAYYGLAGELVRTVEPHSEADPTALLIQNLVCFGNFCGEYLCQGPTSLTMGECRTPYYQVENDPHPPVLFAVIVADTGERKARCPLQPVVSSPKRWLDVTSPSRWRPAARAVENGLVALLDAMFPAKSCYFSLTTSSGFQVWS
jgi:hypothetical protein